jgi:hypothetical protein
VTLTQVGGAGAAGIEGRREPELWIPRRDAGRGESREEIEAGAL